MHRSTQVILGAAFIFGLLSSVPQFSPALAGNARGDYERGIDCKDMRRSGRLAWYSIASGIVNDGGGRSGYRGFVTKACHANESSCRRWLRRVGHEIPNLDTIETAYCKRVG